VSVSPFLLIAPVFVAGRKSKSIQIPILLLVQTTKPLKLWLSLTLEPLDISSMLPWLLI